jgi:creatinine amidohydrolase
MMSDLPNRRYADMTPDYIATSLTGDWIAVLPLGATEQHGPHLPVDTDWMIADGIISKVLQILPELMPVTFLPTERVGYSREHTNRPGAATLTYDGAISRWIEIGEQLHAQGIRKFVMLNAHGGNAPLMTIVATELRARLSMLAVATSWTRFGLPFNVVTPEEKAHGIHGGEIETSVMLALRPDLVRMDEARDFPSLQTEMERTAKHLRAYGPHAFGWMATDLNPNGVVGHAKKATADQGVRIITHAAEGFIELLEDVRAFDVTRFDRS